jgi:hypothetical protein
MTHYYPIKFTEENIQKLFGNEAAEDENIDRLKEYYFKNFVYNKITADLSLRILVGHKGVGKSALFTVAMAEDKENGKLPILIRPDDIADLGQTSSSFLQMIRDWKKGLKRIIAAKVFNSIGLESQAGFFTKAANYGGQLISFLSESIITLKEKISLEPTQDKLLKAFLSTQKINVYIDDLDRGWQSRKDDIQRVSALLNAIRDLSNENKGINFKISLRSDVYYLVRTSDESTDKIEGSVIWYSWTNHEILLLLIKRIETFFGNSFKIESYKNLRQAQLAVYLDPIFEKRFAGAGKWSDVPMYKVLMSMIRKRPRDLVKLCTLGARQAQSAGQSKIGTDHLREIFEEYSQGRIQDTVNEYKSELPDIERLLLGMKPNKKSLMTSDGYVYTTPELTGKIGNIVEQGKFVLASGRVALPKDLAQFLYKINFITARKVIEGEIDRKYFEENRYLSTQLANFGYDWEVHPAFRWALQPDNIEDIFAKLNLSSDK